MMTPAPRAVLGVPAFRATAGVRRILRTALRYVALTSLVAACGGQSARTVAIEGDRDPRAPLLGDEQ